MNEHVDARLEKSFSRLDNRFGTLPLVAGAGLPPRRFRPQAFWSSRVLDTATVYYRECSATAQALVLPSCQRLNEN